MNSLPPARVCPKCGGDLSGAALGGLCPRCMAEIAGGNNGGHEALKADVALPLAEKIGDRIGRYKLVQEIGVGGCGVVYLAQQEEPVRRKVALKIIKLGMDTRE